MKNSNIHRDQFYIFKHWSLKAKIKCLQNMTALSAIMKTDEYTWFQSWGQVPLDSDGCKIMSLLKQGFAVSHTWNTISPLLGTRASLVGGQWEHSIYWRL